MSNVAKLKKKAAEFEQKKQFDKALALYVQILESSDAVDDEADVALYNRVGDLMLRQGSVGDAVTYYEKAVDLYAESGFFNNAIALCSKILRHAPGRSSVYYKLGKISAKKGFNSDAKQNFLEYADRMQKAGQIDEAFRALKEFADLCPDQDDIRLMLAEQLSKKNRKGEAIEQLQTLYAKLDGEGRTTEARATAERMKAIDPGAEPKSSSAPRAEKSSDLVFLDVTYDEPARPAKSKTPPAPAPSPPPSPPRVEPVRPATPPSVPAPSFERVEEIPLEAAGAERLEILPADPLAAAEPADEPGLAPLGAGSAEESPWGDVGHVGSLDGIMHGAELDTPTSFDRSATGETLAGFERTAIDDGPVDLSGGILALDDAPLSGSEFAALRLGTPAQQPTVTSASVHDLALPGELPMLDLPGDEASLGAPLELMLPESGSDPAATRDGADEWGAGTAPTGGGVSLPAGGGRFGPSGDVPLVQFDVGAAESTGNDLTFLDVGAPSENDFAADALSLLEGEPGVDDDARAAIAADLSFDGLRNFDEQPPAPRQPSADDLAAQPPADVSAAHAATTPAAPAARPAIGESVSAGEVSDESRPAAESLQALRSRVNKEQGNWMLRQRLAEALFEAGERDAGLLELEMAMIGYERANDLESARSVADEIIRLNPNSVRHHQKRVEYAFRTNDKTRLADAYIQLADSLFRDGQAEKARAVYQRVLELSPDDIRAQAALSAFVDTAHPSRRDKREKEQRTSTAAGRRYTAEPQRDAPRPTEPELEPVSAGADDFVNLGDWLRTSNGPKSTRMVVDEQAPSGDEQVDFADMLRKFKQGVAENVEDEDHESHYDLGVAFKEMGLLDDAIAEFQKALRGDGRRARTFEALGQCFLEKSQFSVAETILARALREPGVDDERLVGVLYLLGYACEALQKWNEAVEYYQRVFAVDIRFRDVSQRLTTLERAER